MFKNGKRRPEEKDSLVPHGMIWYGTPETPPEPSEEFLESTVRYAQVMEMMRRRARAPGQQSREENGPQPEPATGVTSPAPVPWWRIPSSDPEAAAQAPAFSPPTAAVTPRPKTALPSRVEALTGSSPSTVALNSPATSEVKSEVKETKKQVKDAVKKEEPARIEVRAWMGSAAVINFTRSFLAHSRRLAADGNRLLSRAAAKVIREQAAQPLNPPEAEAQAPAFPPPTTAVTPRPKTALPSRVEALTGSSPTTVALNSPAMSEVKSIKEIKKEVKDDGKKEEPARIEARAWMGSGAVINFARSSLAHSRRLAADGRRLFSRAAAKVIPEQAALPLNPPRVRIVLTGLPLRTKILLARQLSAWKIWNPNVTTDKRLRSAMILAAACALVGLLGVSLASHFASRFLPSHTLHSGSGAGAKIATPSAPASASAVAQPSRSAVAAGPQSPENQKSPAPPAAAKSAEEKPSHHRPEAHRKHHPTGDDEYVAPNTYKYYGQSGSR